MVASIGSRGRHEVDEELWCPKLKGRLTEAARLPASACATVPIAVVRSLDRRRVATAALLAASDARPLGGLGAAAVVNPFEAPTAPERRRIA